MSPLTAAIDAERMAAATAAAAPMICGHVARIAGVYLEVVGVPAAIGEAVQILTDTGTMGAEVVAVDDERVVCMPFGDLTGLRAGSRVATLGRPPMVTVSEHLLGRVIDGLGRPIDGGPPATGQRVTVGGLPPHPLRRSPVDRQLGLGVRVLDTLVPCGRGQRLGIFAGSGVGKSSLLSMIARGTEADVSVVALVGERGREVGEFLERDLGRDGLARSVVVVATSDEPAVVRLRAAMTATRIAEWFRDRGRDVVLMMDSLTRVAMAQREVGLSSGELPATRGYPPSVFALLPRLLERAGAGEVGAITGLYTVLVDGDDMDEPIADAARSILDGHVVLTRRLATAGHFPTVDALESISRVAPSITTPAQMAAATSLRRLLAAHREAKDLLDIGAYSAGSDPLVDRAVAMRDRIDGFLRQRLDESAATGESWRALEDLVEET